MCQVGFRLEMAMDRVRSRLAHDAEAEATGGDPVLEPADAVHGMLAEVTADAAAAGRAEQPAGRADPVAGPLADVAEHVVQTPGVRPQPPDQPRAVRGVVAGPGVLRQLGGVAAEEVRRVRAGFARP